MKKWCKNEKNFSVKNWCKKYPQAVICKFLGRFNFRLLLLAVQLGTGWGYFLQQFFYTKIFAFFTPIFETFSIKSSKF